MIYRNTKGILHDIANAKDFANAGFFAQNANNISQTNDIFTQNARSITQTREIFTAQENSQESIKDKINLKISSLSLAKHLKFFKRFLFFEFFTRDKACVVCCHTEPLAKYPQRIKVLNSIYEYFCFGYVLQHAVSLTLNMTIVRHCERSETIHSLNLWIATPINRLAMTRKTALRAMKTAFAPHCHTGRSEVSIQNTENVLLNVAIKATKNKFSLEVAKLYKHLKKTKI